MQIGAINLETSVTQLKGNSEIPGFYTEFGSWFNTFWGTAKNKTKESLFGPIKVS